MHASLHIVSYSASTMVNTNQTLQSLISYTKMKFEIVWWITPDSLLGFYLLEIFFFFFFAEMALESRSIHLSDEWMNAFALIPLWYYENEVTQCTKYGCRFIFNWKIWGGACNIQYRMICCAGSVAFPTVWPITVHMQYRKYFVSPEILSKSFQSAYSVQILREHISNTFDMLLTCSGFKKLFLQSFS